MATLSQNITNSRGDSEREREREVETNRGGYALKGSRGAKEKKINMRTKSGKNSPKKQKAAAKK